MSPITEKKSALIQQMLLKAESTTPEEAEALLEAATKLMARYGVTEAMLQAKGDKAKETIVQRQVIVKGIYARELMFMIHWTCIANGSTRILMTKIKDTEYRLSLYGYESDADAMVVLADSLMIQAAHATAAWWKENRQRFAHLAGFDQFVQRREFVSGFGRGVAEKMREAMTVAVQESDASGSTGTALVLRDRGKEVADFVDARGGKGRAFRAGSGSYEAQAAGRSAGRNAALTNQRTIKN